MSNNVSYCFEVKRTQHVRDAEGRLLQEYPMSGFASSTGLTKEEIAALDDLIRMFFDARELKNRRAEALKGR